MIVVPSASALVAVAVAVPPVLAALSRATPVPSQVAAAGAEVGQVTDAAGVKVPLPQVNVEVAAAPPAVAA